MDKDILKENIREVVRSQLEESLRSKAFYYGSATLYETVESGMRGKLTYDSSLVNKV